MGRPPRYSAQAIAGDVSMVVGGVLQVQATQVPTLALAVFSFVCRAAQATGVGGSCSFGDGHLFLG